MLIVDAREAWKPKNTGKGRWSQGLLKELAGKNVPMTFLSHDPPPGDWNRILRPDHKVILFPETGFRWHLRAHAFLKKNPGCIFLATTSYLLPALSSASVKFVPVVHDLIAFQNEPHDRRARWIERLTLGRAISRAWKICTVSESTSADLKKLYPSIPDEKIRAVFAGPGDGYASAAQPDGKTIVCLATLCPRKNQLRLIEAFRLLPDAVRSQASLVLVGGRGWQDDEIVEKAESTSGVTWVGYLPDNELSELFSHCSVFAYPSLYEGFGLPVLDAMRMGIPVLTSDRGGLREVAGDAALCVDPLSVPSIADGLLRLLTDEQYRAELSEKGKQRAALFSWHRTAELCMQHLSIDNIA